MENGMSDHKTYINHRENTHKHVCVCVCDFELNYRGIQSSRTRKS